MFQHILVPLDGSALAERAIPCAARLAQRTGATLHLVRVVPLPPAQGAADGMYVLASYADLTAAETEAATAYLDTVSERLAHAGLTLRVAHPTGDISASLLDYERANGIDLVTMCSHGRSGLARFSLGSIAARLLHHGTVPVLLVRAFGAPVTLERCMVPLDGSAMAEEALAILRAVALHGPHDVTLLRVIGAPAEGPEAERYLRDVSLRLQHQGLFRGGERGCTVQVARGDPARTILDVAGDDRLIIMATHGRSGLTRWALGSVTDRVSRGGPAGVLVVRAGTTSRAAEQEPQGN